MHSVLILCKICTSRSYLKSLKVIWNSFRQIYKLLIQRAADSKNGCACAQTEFGSFYLCISHDIFAAHSYVALCLSIALHYLILLFYTNSFNHMVYHKTTVRTTNHIITGPSQGPSTLYWITKLYFAQIMLYNLFKKQI